MSGAPAISAERLALMASSGPLPKCPTDLITKEQMQRLYYRTTQSTDVPGRQPQKESDENFLDIHNIGQRPTKYMPVDGFKAPLVNRLACQHTKAYTPLPLGDNAVNKALAANFKMGVSASTQALYKPLGAEPVSQQDFPEYSTAEMATCRQKSCKPKAGLTNTLGGLGDLLVTKSHEHTHYQEPRRDIMKARRAKLPRAGLDIGGEGRPVRGRTAYDHQFGIEQAERGRNFLKKEASLPTLGFWSHGQVPSLAVPDMHPVMLAGQTFKRVPMMSPGQ
jgi:hypothetical protein